MAHASNQLASNAATPEPISETIQLASYLDNLAESAGSLLSRLDMMADRALGSMPSEKPAASPPQAVPNGAADMLRSKIDRLGRLIENAAGSVTRIETFV